MSETYELVIRPNRFVLEAGSPAKLIAAGMQGPAGPAGADGAAGPAGPAGADGAAGPAGPAGPGVVVGGATGQVLAKASAADYDTTWITVAGTGTVTSVALTAPGLFAVAGSPVTTSGTLALSLANQAANTVLAGPTTGAAAAPTMRTLVAADLPFQDIARTGQANTFTGQNTFNAPSNAQTIFSTDNLPGYGIGFSSTTTYVALIGTTPPTSAPRPFVIQAGNSTAQIAISGGDLILSGGRGTPNGTVYIKSPDNGAVLVTFSTAGDVAATTFTGSGVNLTALNASNLTSGTVPDARLSANVPLLTAGKLPTSTLPALAITEFLGTVASQAAMLALVGQRGDWCIRSDDSHVYVLTADDPTSAANWQAISYPAAPVTAVNDQTGNVTLGAADVGAQPANANLTTLAGTAITAAGTALLDDADAAAQRTTLGLGLLATKADVDLAADVTGTLPAGNLPTTVVQDGDTKFPGQIAWVLANGVDATTGTDKTASVILTRDCTFKGVRLAGKIGPTGADLIIDLKLNGVSLWAVNTGNRPKITNGSTGGSQTLFDTTAGSAGDLLTIDITQVGSTTAGQSITVVLYYDQKN